MKQDPSALSPKTHAGTAFMFITLLRTIATCLITNTHYNDIYPISALAVGGLIGDVLFFVISGYCLANIGNIGFFPWFGKRVMRIYPTVWVISIVLLCTGFYDAASCSLPAVFLYPTQFHFIGSIILMYLIFYPVLRSKVLREHLPWVMLGVAVLWLGYYWFFVDRSIRLDVAELPITKFLYLEGMLFGAYVRRNSDKYINKHHWGKWVWLFASLVLYLLSKIVIDRFGWMDLQFVIFLLLFSICAAFLLAFCGIEKYLPTEGWFAKLLGFIAPLTLEIYVVQKAIIPHTDDFVFPVNFVVTTLCILLAAWLLNRFVNLLVQVVRTAVKKLHK